MFYCCKCGNKLNDGDCFCMYCGYSIKERKEGANLNLKTNNIANSDLIKSLKLNKLTILAFIRNNKLMQIISLVLLIFQLLIINPIAKYYKPKVLIEFKEVIILSIVFLITVLLLEYFKLLKGILLRTLNVIGAIISALPCLVCYQSMRRISGFFEIIDIYHQSYFLAFLGVILPIVTTILLIISYLSDNKNNVNINL